MATPALRWAAAAALLAGTAAGAARSARADSMASGAPSTSFAITNFVTGTGQTTDFRFLPDGRLVLTSRQGTVFVRPAGGGALVTSTIAVATAEDEQGLLGVAVAPDFATSRDLIFYYSAAGANENSRHRVVKRKLAADGRLEAGEVIILDKLRGPANHDGGALEVGPDGLLYVGVGDTGCNSGAEPEGQAQPTNFYGTCLSDDPANNGAANGKILRINLDGTVPQSNPLVGRSNVTRCGPSCGDAISGAVNGAPREAIYAWGFRNPWRLWVDPMTSKLWVGDVGEVSYEEITVVQPGRHHGWPWREGRRGFPVSKCRDVRVGTAAGGAAIMDGDCVDPVYVCRHSSAQDTTLDGNCTSITGGLIIDSCDWPAAFRGRYYFGDNDTQAIWSFQVNATRDGMAAGARREDFAAITGGLPVSMRGGLDGALYIAVFGSAGAASGRLARVAPRTPEACQPGQDSGVPSSDGGGVINPPGPGGSRDDGCGCRAGAHGGAGGLVLLLALFTLLARRAARRP